MARALHAAADFRAGLYIPRSGRGDYKGEETDRCEQSAESRMGQVRRLPIHRAVRQLHLLAVMQRALRGLGLRLAPAFRRPRLSRRPRPSQELHLEIAAGGCPSEMVSTRCSAVSASTRATINALLQVVVRQSEPPTATLGRSNAAFCSDDQSVQYNSFNAGAAERLDDQSVQYNSFNAGAAERLTDSENCEEHYSLQTPALEVVRNYVHGYTCY